MADKTHKKRPDKNGNLVPTAEFGDLNYKEQAQSINMTKLNLRKMEKAHRRRAKEEGRR